jgi:tyrosine-protein phosphatase YwqE
MKFVIPVVISDSVTVEALQRAKSVRKMAQFVNAALVHYIRIEEGKKTLNLLTNSVLEEKIQHVFASDQHQGESANREVRVIEASASGTPTQNASSSRSFDDFLK